MWVRIPLESFNGFTLSHFQESNTMSNTMSNKNNNLTINGFPNLHNDIVLAALLDTVGLTLTRILNDIGQRAYAAGVDYEGTITIDEMQVLISSQRLLQEMRSSIPVSSTVENVREVTGKILDEMDAYKHKSTESLAYDVAAIMTLAKEMGMEDLAKDFLREQGLLSQRERETIQPSAADVADSILNDLRETGTIGGSRAV
jgi:hypothetical protein